jgi:hypothetical protein
MNRQERDEARYRCAQQRLALTQALANLLAMRAAVHTALEHTKTLDEHPSKSLQTTYEDILVSVADKETILQAKINEVLATIYHLRRRFGADVPTTNCEEHTYIKVCPYDRCTTYAITDSRGFEFDFPRHYHHRACADCGHITGHWTVHMLGQRHPADSEIISGVPPYAIPPSP